MPNHPFGLIKSGPMEPVPLGMQMRASLMYIKYNDEDGIPLGIRAMASPLASMLHRELAGCKEDLARFVHGGADPQ